MKNPAHSGLFFCDHIDEDAFYGELPVSSRTTIPTHNPKTLVHDDVTGCPVRLALNMTGIERRQADNEAPVYQGPSAPTLPAAFRWQNRIAYLVLPRTRAPIASTLSDSPGDDSPIWKESVPTDFAKTAAPGTRDPTARAGLVCSL